MIVIPSLLQEHLPLTREASLGSQKASSEMPSLLVSPVAGVTAQVSMCLIRVWESVQQEDKALPSWGSCSYGEDVTEREVGGLTSWLPP